MTDLEEILARAAQPGVFVERRHFTLSRTSAIEKLRTFALRRPGQAVLELVQAAVFAGATYIAIDTQGDRIIVAWVGTPPLLESQLDNLFDYLFADAAHAAHRHLVELALAVNAMLRDEGGSVRIESGSGRRGETLRLDLDPSGGGIVGVSEVALSGTYVAMERSRPWWKFWQRPAVSEEQVLVEEQCRHTPVPILLNGTAPFGYRATRRIRSFHQGGERAFDEGPAGRRGSLFLTPHESRVEIIVAGVRITTLALDELGTVQAPRLAGGMPHRFSGVVCDDALRKTADQGDIVRDDRYAAMLRALHGPSVALARVHDPTWDSPLPHSVETGRLNRLPAMIPQLAPRPPIALEAILALDVGTPLFRMLPNPGDLPSLGHAADPRRLPFPVLLLTDREADLLENQLGRPVGRLTDAASVALTVRVLAGRGGLHVLDAQTTDREGRVWQAMVWSEKGPPRMGKPGELMVLEMDHDRTTRIHTIPFDVPGLCVSVQGSLPDAVSPSVLQTLVLRNCAPPILRDPSVPLALRAAILAAVLRVDASTDGGLRVSLPPGWTTAGLEISLNDWAKHIEQGTRLVVSSALSTALEPLELAVAVGHLGTTLHGAPVDGVQWVDGNWIPAPPAQPLPKAAALIVWDGPPPATAKRLSLQSFVTVHGPSDWMRLAAGAAVLHAQLLARPATTARDGRLQMRWIEALAHAFDRPEWSTIESNRPTILRGGIAEGPREAAPLAYGVARSSRRLAGLTTPSWASTGEVKGGWWCHQTFAEGWLAIPARQSPRACPPRILIDTGLERRWIPTKDLLPCVGVLQLAHPTARSLWPYVSALWLSALSQSCIPTIQPWLARARSALSPDSLLGLHLAVLEDAANAPDDMPTVHASVLRALQAAEAPEQDVEALLAAQRRILHQALGRTPFRS